MSFNYKELDSGAIITVDGEEIHATQQDIQQAWWDAADAYDRREHLQVVPMTIADTFIVLNPNELRQLYDATTRFIERIALDDEVDVTYH